MLNLSFINIRLFISLSIHTQASVPVGGSIQGSLTDKRCGVQDPAEPWIKDDDGTPGLSGP
jgi:hypothetical protein